MQRTAVRTPPPEVRAGLPGGLRWRGLTCVSPASPPRADHRAVVCPLCAQTIHFEEVEDVHAVFERHRVTTCRPEGRAGRVKKDKCKAPGCKEVLSLSNRVTCSSCRAEVCLRHRFPDDHACSRVPPRVARQAGTGSSTAGTGSTAAGFFGTVASAVGLGAGASAAAPKVAAPKVAAPKAAAKRENPADVLRETAHRRMKAGGGGGAGARAGTTASGVIEIEDDEGRSDPCPFCSSSFADAAALLAHVAASHGEAVGGGGPRRAGAGAMPVGVGGGGLAQYPPSPLRCPTCGRTFPPGMTGALAEHVGREHPSSSCALM
jgi:hypothetical protein